MNLAFMIFHVVYNPTWILIKHDYIPYLRQCFYRHKTTMLKIWHIENIGHVLFHQNGHFPFLVTLWGSSLAQLTLSLTLDFILVRFCAKPVTWWDAPLSKYQFLTCTYTMVKLCQATSTTSSSWEYSSLSPFFSTTFCSSMSILYMNLVLVGFILLSFNLHINSIQIILIKKIHGLLHKWWWYSFDSTQMI